MEGCKEWAKKKSEGPLPTQAPLRTATEGIHGRGDPNCNYMIFLIARLY